MEFFLHPFTGGICFLNFKFLQKLPQENEVHVQYLVTQE